MSVQQPESCRHGYDRRADCGEKFKCKGRKKGDAQDAHGAGTILLRNLCQSRNFGPHCAEDPQIRQAPHQIQQVAGHARKAHPLAPVETL